MPVDLASQIAKVDDALHRQSDNLSPPVTGNFHIGTPFHHKSNPYGKPDDIVADEIRNGAEFLLSGAFQDSRCHVYNRIHGLRETAEKSIRRDYKLD